MQMISNMIEFSSVEEYALRPKEQQSLSNWINVWMKLAEHDLAD